MKIQGYFRSQTSATPSSSQAAPSISSFAASPTPNEPIKSTEKDASSAPLQRTSAGPHCRQFSINWASLRCPEGRLLDHAQYRIRHKRNVGDKGKISWVYQYGAELESRPNHKWWLCEICHAKKRHERHIFAAESTSSIADHLNSFHKIEKDGSKQEAEGQQEDFFLLTQAFNEDVYKQKLIDWCIKLRLSYREVTDEATVDLLTYGKPSLERLLPQHHSTLSRWVKESFADRLAFILKVIQCAISDITLSVDGWRALNKRDYIAVCAHFVGT